MHSDAEWTLQKIAKIGFKGLEYPDTFGLPAAALKKMIAANKLYSMGGGNTMATLTKNFDAIVNEYHQMGKKYVLCYWPWLDNGKNKTADNWKENAAVFNQLGNRFKKEGLRLGYHNHDIEFAVVEGQIPYDILLEYGDPDSFTFQMDIWWIYTGGQDSVRFIEKYPGRFELCHIKTKEILSKDASVQNLDYKRILSHSNKAGFKEFILENEPNIPEPLDFMQRSYDFMRTIF